MSTSCARVVLTAGVAAVLTLPPITALVGQASEPIGRTLRDPSRVREPREPTRVGILALPAGPRIALFFTPSGTFTSATRAGGQFKGSGDIGHGITWTLYAADSYIHGSSASHNRAQGGTEFDRDLTQALSLSVGGELANTSSVSSDAETFGELDAAVTPISTTLGGIAYYDWTKPSGGSRTGGATFGLTANYKAPSGTRVLAEYDFRSDFNGEDSFSAKLVQSLGKYGRHGAQAIVGAGKHRVVTFAVKIALNKS
jgi:hypothetical protein